MHFLLKLSRSCFQCRRSSEAATTISLPAAYAWNNTRWTVARIISEGDPTWIHPIVLIKKKPLDAKPEDEPKYRVCLDLRAINKVMQVESYPMPTLNSIIESFGDPPPRFCTVLDAISGFLQLPVTKKSSKLLGLESDSKTYVMNRVPFGLVTSPFVYQKQMNKL